MKPNVFAVFALFQCLFISSHAQKYKSILFRVMHPEKEKVSFLFGTHHAFGTDFLDSLNIVKEKLKSTDILITETIYNEIQMSEDIINARTEISDWHKYLSKREIGVVSDWLEKSPVDFNKMYPAELSSVLYRIHNIKVCKTKALDDTSTTLDNHIMELAKSYAIVTKGLESAAEQLELIRRDVEGMPKKIHKKRLKAIVKAIEEKDQSLCAGAEQYRNMDFDYQLSKPCGNTLILTSRNNKWMKVLFKEIEYSSCFIAVGLSHLMFECGLVQQLRDNGYIVEPVAL